MLCDDDLYNEPTTSFISTTSYMNPSSSPRALFHPEFTLVIKEISMANSNGEIDHVYLSWSPNQAIV